MATTSEKISAAEKEIDDTLLYLELDVGLHVLSIYLSQGEARNRTSIILERTHEEEATK